MIHFNLNIKLFYNFELENDSKIRAIAVIEYPILYIIAKTLETMEEEYDELDKFIVKSAYKHEGFTIQQLSELTGLGSGVFEYRVAVLEKQGYISLIGNTIFPIEKGMKFMMESTFKREIEKTRHFLLDGVTHQPLKSYFYKDGKDYLISEDERDLYGNKLFNPSIIHNPPSKYIQQHILNIPIDERLRYNIPEGLKEIKDYDFVLKTYPVAIVFSRTRAGITKKRLIDLNGISADEECVNNWQNSLTEEIKKVEIIIEERPVLRNGATKKQINFKNNWAKTRTAAENRIFNITKDKLSYFIQKLYGLLTIDENNIDLNDHEIKINVDKKLFETKGVDKKKLIESCSRYRDYYRQYERTGVWLVFFELIIADDYVQGLVNLSNLLKEAVSLKDLLFHYKYDYKALRQNLIAIDNFDKLEELDIYLFLHARETNYNQNYLTLTSE